MGDKKNGTKPAPRKFPCAGCGTTHAPPMCQPPRG
jgi:hypothetical protein